MRFTELLMRLRAVIALVALTIVFSVLSPEFLTPANMDRPWYAPPSYGRAWSGKSQMPFFFVGQIWKSPERLLQKAICRPSRE